MVHYRPALGGSPAGLSACDAHDAFWREVTTIVLLRRAGAYDDGKTASGYPEIRDDRGRAVVPRSGFLWLFARFGQRVALALEADLAGARTHADIRRLLDAHLLTAPLRPKEA